MIYLTTINKINLHIYIFSKISLHIRYPSLNYMGAREEARDLALALARACSLTPAVSFTFRNLPGWGQFGAAGRFLNVNDTVECAQKCVDTVGCYSYEYSKILRRCNLNKEA